MSVKVKNPATIKVGRSEAKRRAQTMTNVERAHEAWGQNIPKWVELLACHCDRTNQTQVAATLGRSGPYVSRILNATYPGNYAEAEKLVRAAFGDEEVPCPIWGDIPLANCMGLRRGTLHLPAAHARMHARNCPVCPFNTDREDA